MCNKIILENGGTLMSVLDFYKNQEMCDKAVDTHPFTIKYVPKCYKAQEMCYKAILRCFFYLILFLINIKLKKYVR